MEDASSINNARVYHAVRSRGPGQSLGSQFGGTFDITIRSLEQQTPQWYVANLTSKRLQFGSRRSLFAYVSLP